MADFALPKIDFTKNLSDREIMKITHCVVNIERNILFVLSMKLLVCIVDRIRKQC